MSKLDFDKHDEIPQDHRNAIELNNLRQDLFKAQKESEEKFKEAASTIKDMETTFNRTIAFVREQRDQAQDEVVQQKLLVSKLNDVIDQLKSQLKELNSKLETYSRDIAINDDLIKQQTDVLRQRDDDRNSLEQEISKLKTEIQSLIQENQQLRNRILCFEPNFFTNVDISKEKSSGADFG